MIDRWAAFAGLGIWVALISLSGGCGTMMMGGGSTDSPTAPAYSKGDLDVTAEASLRKTYKAAQSAMKELSFGIFKTEQDNSAGTVEGRSSTGKPVRINLHKISARRTLITIRIGAFGDESLSRLLLAKIENHLL